MKKQFDKLISLADKLDIKGHLREARLIDAFLYREAIPRGTLEGYQIQKICEELKKLHKSSIISKVSSGKKEELVANVYMQIAKDVEQLHSRMKENVEERGVTDRLYVLVTQTIGYFSTAIGLYKQNFIDAKRMVAVLHESIEAIRDNFKLLRISPNFSNQEEAVNKLEDIDKVVNNLLSQLERALEESVVNVGSLEAVAESVSKQFKDFMSEESKGEFSLKGLFESGVFQVKSRRSTTLKTLLEKARESKAYAPIVAKYEEQLERQKLLQKQHAKAYIDAVLKFESFKEKVANNNDEIVGDEEEFIAKVQSELYHWDPREEEKEKEEEEALKLDASIENLLKTGSGIFLNMPPDLLSDPKDPRSQIESRIEKLRVVTDQRALVERNVEKLKSEILKGVEKLQQEQVKSTWNEFVNTINQHLQRIKVATKDLNNIDKAIKDFGEKVVNFEATILPVFGLEPK